MQYKGSIKNRLIIIIMSVTLLTALIGYGSFVYWYMNNQYDRALNLSKTLGLVLGQDIAKVILLNDVSAAADISSSLKSFSNLESMVLYKLNGNPVLQYSKDRKSFLPDKVIKKQNITIENDILMIYTDAKYQNTHLGYVQLKLEIDTIEDVIKRNINALLLILGLMFILSYLLATYFAKKFTDPILKLVQFLEKIDLTDSLNKRIKLNKNIDTNEYGKLYDEVNKMLERLETSHENLKIAAVTFETQSGITITDKDQKILQVNKSFVDITGYSSDEVIGATPRVLQSGVHGKEFYDEMKQSLKEKHVWMGEIVNRHKDGSLVNEHLTIHAILDQNKEVSYYVASFVDNTLLKQTEAKLIEKEDQLIQKSKMAAMGEMIENIAHQWRQPLSVISTVSTGMLLKKELEIPLEKKEEVDQLNKINDTVKHLSQTINDFREFFKVDKEANKFEIKTCYKKVLNILSSKFTALNIEIVENIDDVEIFSLENELIQVLLNIFNNSKDVLQEKNREDKKLIFIDIYKEDLNAVISIKDNGGGIPENIIDKVFDSYFTTKEKDGTGIGLNMSREMVEKHMYGKISVKNTNFTYQDVEYKGADFTISIPL